MMEILNPEGAYQALAKDVMAFAGQRRWDVLGGNYRIYKDMVSCEWWIEVNGVRDERGDVPPNDVNRMACRAVKFLREFMFHKSGSRIWGLVSKLHPNGKFNIEYDYSKPEGYEETDETVDLSQALEELQKPGVHISGPV